MQKCVCNQDKWSAGFQLSGLRTELDKVALFFLHFGCYYPTVHPRSASTSRTRARQWHRSGEGSFSCLTYLPIQWTDRQPLVYAECCENLRISTCNAQFQQHKTASQCCTPHLAYFFSLLLWRKHRPMQDAPGFTSKKKRCPRCGLDSSPSQILILGCVLNSFNIRSDTFCGVLVFSWKMQSDTSTGL